MHVDQAYSNAAPAIRPVESSLTEAHQIMERMANSLADLHFQVSGYGTGAVETEPGFPPRDSLVNSADRLASRLASLSSDFEQTKARILSPNVTSLSKGESLAYRADAPRAGTALGY